MQNSQGIGSWVHSRAAPRRFPVTGAIRVFAILIVLLAFLLRVWGLTSASLWYDETFVLSHAAQGLWRVVTSLLREDNALPLHGLLAALWMQVAGSGEFAARFLSVLLGTLSAPLIYRLGRAVSGGRVSGIGSALAYATLPIFVYYSQEVRMYALALPLAAGFTWAGWRLVTCRRGVRAYVALGVLMLAAHLYTVLMWAVVGLWGTLSLVLGLGAWRGPTPAQEATYPAAGLRHAWLRVRRADWWRANLLLALGTAPIFLWAWWRVRVDATAVSAIPLGALRWIPVLYGVGQFIAPPWAWLFVIAAVLAIAAALALLSARPAHRQGTLWILLSLTLPVLALFLLTSIKAKWSERYLLPSWGLAGVLAVGTGWELLLAPVSSDRMTARSAILRGACRALGVLLVLVWLGLTLPALARQVEGSWALALQDEWHPRPDFRGVARYIAQHDAPTDVIVVVGGYASSSVDFYYDGPAHLFGLPFATQVLDTSRVVDLDALEILEREAGSHRRLWLVLWQDHLADPTNLVQSVLVETCRRLPVDADFTNVGLLLFDLDTCRPLDQLASPPHRLDATFAAPIRLQGYDLSRNGSTWEVDLWWETTGSLSRDYGVFVHLVDADGSLIDQHDHIAGADAYPTSAWRAGTRLRDRFFLEVPQAMCEGCRLHVGLYTPEGRLRLQTGGELVEVPVVYASDY